MVPPNQLLKKATAILNQGKRVIMPVGQGGLRIEGVIEKLSYILGAPIIKSLLGKAVVSDTHPNCLGGLEMLVPIP